MFDKKRDRDPTAMRVEFVLGKGDEQRYRGMLLLRAEESESEFLRPEAVGRMTMSCQFELPTANIIMKLDEPGDRTGHALVEWAFAMGVHQSVEWESLTLGEYVFWFRCTPLFWPDTL